MCGTLDRRSVYWTAMNGPDRVVRLMEDPPPQPLRRRTWIGLAARLAFLAGVVVALHLFIDWVLVRAETSAHGEMLTIGLVGALVLAYALLIAVPFVPGIEIGLALLALRGAEVAPVVYLATVAGLMLAFLAGHKLPLGWLHQRLEDLRLSRAAQFVAEVQPMPPERRLAVLRARLPDRIAGHAVRWRYVALALLVNMPGSGLIGGGGGICLLAGLTRIFRPGATLATLALAVAPVPIVVWFTGVEASWVFTPR